MTKKEIVLMALAPAKSDHTPVQVQKSIFLIDRNISESIGGERFNFVPYSYGPFDIDVYKTLEQLQEEGMVEINRGQDWKTYRLTAEGQEEGERLLQSIESSKRDYITAVSEFVQKLSFNALVSAFYKAYPDMRVNSVFRD